MMIVVMLLIYQILEEVKGRKLQPYPEKNPERLVEAVTTLLLMVQCRDSKIVLNCSIQCASCRWKDDAILLSNSIRGKFSKIERFQNYCDFYCFNLQNTNFNFRFEM
jgi:hypothetical protein